MSAFAKYASERQRPEWRSGAGLWGQVCITLMMIDGWAFGNKVIDKTAPGSRHGTLGSRGHCTVQGTRLITICRVSPVVISKYQP